MDVQLVKILQQTKYSVEVTKCQQIFLKCQYRLPDRVTVDRCRHLRQRGKRACTAAPGWTRQSCAGRSRAAVSSGTFSSWRWSRRRPRDDVQTRWHWCSRRWRCRGRRRISAWSTRHIASLQSTHYPANKSVASCYIMSHRENTLKLTIMILSYIYIILKSPFRPFNTLQYPYKDDELYRFCN